MKKKNTLIILSLIASLTFSLGACSLENGGFIGDAYDKVVGVLGLDDYGSIELDQTELTLTVGESAIVKATTSKSDVKVVWSTTDVGVVDVYNGLVKGLAEGTTTLVAQIEGSNKKATCSVTVNASAPTDLKNIQAFVGDGEINLALDVNSNYSIKAEKLLKGVYTDAEHLLKGAKFSTEEVGTYKITYTMGNEETSRFVYVNAEKSYKEYMVVDALDGSTEFKSHISQSSVDVLLEPEGSTEYSQYIEEDVSDELAQAGYNGQIDNDMLYRIEKEVVKFSWGGTYFYFDITPENTDVFDNLDTFDNGAYLSIWYRVQCDADGNGYKPATTTYNYLYRENRSGLSLIVRNQGVNVIAGSNGWFNWRLSLSSIGELVGSDRFIFNIGQWAAGGKFIVDLYGVEIVSPYYDELVEGREFGVGERIPFEIPNPGIQNMAYTFDGVYENGTKLVEGEDYNLFDYARKKYIVDLEEGEYTLRYTINGNGLITNSEDGFVLESPLTVKAPVYLNPAVFAGGLEEADEVTYFQAGSWSSINSSTSTTVETLAQEDYQALINAGYQGVLDKLTVNRASIKTTSVNGDKTRGAVGFVFDLTENHRLFTTGSDASVKANYYISVWIRASETIGSDMRFIACDTKTLKQATAGEYNWVDLPANKWTEIRLPIQLFQNGNYYLNQQGGSNPKAGIYFASIFAKQDITIDVYSAELCMNSVSIQEGETVDAKFYSGAFITGAKLDSIAVYDGKNALSEGIDYTLENNKIYGLTKGNYEVRFYVSGNGYLEDCYVARKVTVTKPITNAVLFDDMSKSGTVKAYTQAYSTNSSKLLTDCIETVSTSTTITADEYQALLNAGYKGSKTDLNAQQIVFGSYSARQNVYFQFDETMNHEILQASLKGNYSNLYVSIWLKSNTNFSYDTYTAVIGQTTKFASIQDIQPTLDQTNVNWLTATTIGQWVEVMIPLNKYADVGYYISNGYLSANETYAYGFSLINCAFNNYLNNSTFTIYSMELTHVGLKGVQGMGVLIDLPSALFGTGYEVEIYNGTQKLVSGTDYTLSDNTVNGLNKGEYTLVYTLLDEKFTKGQQLKVSLEIFNPLTSATVLSDMSKANDATAYVTEVWNLDPVSADSRTKIDSTVYTMSTAEMESLAAAGYNGEDTGSATNRFTFASSYKANVRQSVYIPFNSLYRNEMLQDAIKNRREGLYISVWLKANKKIYSQSIYGLLMGEESQKPTTFGWAGLTLEADTWVELKLPIYQQGNNNTFSYCYGWGLGEGHYTAEENISGGIYLYQCSWEQLSGAVIDIASVELRVADKTATAGTAQDVAIPSSIYGTYEIAILDSTGADVTANCAVSGTKVTVSTAGTYTIVYKMTGNKFSSGVTVKAKLTVS